MNRIFMPSLFIFISFSALCQTNTDEMLGAPKAHYFLQLWPDFENSKFNYTLDSDGPSSKAKTLKNLTLGVPIKNQEIALTIQFYNPLRYTVKTSDISLTDPSYESIGKFATALTGLLAGIPNAPPESRSQDQKDGRKSTTSESKVAAELESPLAIYTAGKFDTIAAHKGNKLLAPKALEVTNEKESWAWAHKINSLKAEELSEWKFNSLQGNIKCIDTNSKVLKSLKVLDEKYFDGSVRGVMKEYLIKLSLPDNIDDFQIINKTFKTILDSLDKTNQNNTRLLQAFNEVISDDISKDLLQKDLKGDAEASCLNFAVYSQITFKRFVRARAEFQEKRNQMISLAKKINEEVDNLMTKAVQLPNGARRLDNAFILNRYDIQHEKMRDIRITVQGRKLNLNGTPPSIENTDKQFEGKVRLRAAQTFVPEFSLGGFYTNLSFPVYSVKVQDGKSVIGKTDEDYNVGVAGMLNMTLNAINGLAHPLVQLGVGSGKDRPTFLSGAGFRLTWKMPIVITYGAIWQWQQQLSNGKKEGDAIADDTELKRNIDYKFRSRPGFYLGLQIGL